ncbi:hypothetical protein BB561_005190 [Smittium simulii]|uniref:Uncharacterized protein n=1 Tax=Smittium simulii TaxID=133385 RepID=A0A2T9YBN3_9FUNG|nr:hypothetical protein BB561_005190 [Smittium simulii]
MDFHAFQDQETFNQIKRLTDKGDQLLRERGFQEELEDPYVITQLQLTYLTTYPELIEALPLIEEDFFRSPLTEEKHKNTIKRSKKDRIRTNNPTLDTAEDPKTMFAITMRSLLSEIAATITQARVDNLYKEMSLSGKQRGLIALDTKPLIGQKILDILVASKKPLPKRHRAQPFCKCIITTRQQNLIPRNEVSSNTATAQSTNAAANSSYQNQDRNGKGIQDSIHEPNFKQRPTADVTSTAEQKKADKGSQQSLGRGDVIPPVKTSYRKVIISRARNSPRPRLEKTQPSRREAKLQDGNNIHNMLHGPPKELPYVFRSLARSFAQPVIECARSKGIRVSVHLDNLMILGEIKELCTTNTHLIYSKLLELVFKVNEENSLASPSQSITHFDTVINTRNMSLKTTSFKIRDLRGLDNIEMPREFHRKSSVNAIKIINVNSNSFESCNPKPTLLKKSTEIMGRTLVFAQERRILPNADAHQFQGTTDRIWENHVSQTTGIIRNYSVTLPESKNQTLVIYVPLVLNPADSPSRLTAQNRYTPSNTDIPNPKSVNSPLLNDNHWQFMTWRISGVSSKLKGSIFMPLTLPFSMSDVSDVYSEIFIKEKLKVGTIKAYKSAILRLAANSTELANYPMFSEFIKTLDDYSIRSFVKPNGAQRPNSWSNNLLQNYPVSSLQLLKEWFSQPFSKKVLKQLTSHFWENACGQINQGVLYLTIVASKEKRDNRKDRSKSFPTPHANNRMWAVNRLIQFANESKTPLSMDSITRYIYSISGLINEDKNTHMSKGRAIEATLAANSGVSTDDIVSHAF